MEKIIEEFMHEKVGMLTHPIASIYAKQLTEKLGGKIPCCGHSCCCNLDRKGKK